ncbi:hypothetical protein GCM10010342_76880 [Streptomyces anulatus]|nr:hypothetical protein GCM10010342_76880 [Streptomyces anulatus]
MRWRCFLCNGRLTADRLLGTFTAETGLLTDPTELWGCPHMPVAPPPGPPRHTKWWLLVLQTALFIAASGALLLRLWRAAVPSTFPG